MRDEARERALSRYVEEEGLPIRNGFTNTFLAGYDAGLSAGATITDREELERQAREFFARHEYARLYKAVAFAEQYKHAIDAVESLMCDFALSLSLPTQWVEVSERLPTDNKRKWVTFVSEDGETGIASAYRTSPEYPWADWETGDFFNRGEIIAWHTFFVPAPFVKEQTL